MLHFEDVSQEEREMMEIDTQDEHHTSLLNWKDQAANGKNVPTTDQIEVTRHAQTQEKPRSRSRSPSHSLPERSWCRNFRYMEFMDVTSMSFWRACLAEFVGTFLLCFFTIGMGLSMPDTTPPPLLQNAIGTGFFIAVMITSLAAVSGCHINPALTLGFATIRHISICRAIAYTLFQCLGAVSGSMLLRDVIHPDMVGNLGVIVPADGVTDKQAIIMEIMITSFLVFVIIAMVDKGRSDIQGSVPLMVGLAVCVNILIGAQTSGGCMNPARALGPAVIMGDFRRHWIYWVGPCVGGVVGSLVYDKLFSVGVCSYLVCCCNPQNNEYEAALRKEMSKVVLEMETHNDEV